ncbi:hypothetical protein MTO96_002498 [Rhipicephalus appendiculatus]
MPDSSMRDQASMNIRTELATVTQPARADVTTSSAPEDLFSFGLQTHPAETQDELSRYLLVPGDYPLSQMRNFEGLKKLFLKYNTAVPSSASVERLFNIANEVLTKKVADLGRALVTAAVLDSVRSPCLRPGPTGHSARRAFDNGVGNEERTWRASGEVPARSPAVRRRAGVPRPAAHATHRVVRCARVLGSPYA